MTTAKVRTFGKVRVLDLTGAIRISAGDTTLRTAVDALLDQGHAHLLLNLAHVPFIDTMALGELVRARKRARERGGVIKLLSPALSTVHVLQITKLDGIFEIFDNEIAALASFT